MKEKISLLKPKFVFYHIPKCGGNTVRFVLYNYFISLFNKEQIYYPELSTNNINFVNRNTYEQFIRSKSEKDLMDIRVILCHVRYNYPNISDRFGEHDSAIVVREPASRVISQFEFSDKERYGKHITELASDELSDYCNVMGNEMTKYLSWDCNLDNAIENIKKIKFVGTTEDIDGFCKKIFLYFNEKYNLNYSKTEILIKNKNKNKITNKSLYENVRKLLRNSNDQKLYDYVKSNIL